jgi:hypothetical protein
MGTATRILRCYGWLHIYWHDYCVCFRIKKGYPYEARVITRVLPAFLADFFPPQDIMNKVIGEFISSQQPYPQLIAKVVFQVRSKVTVIVQVGSKVTVIVQVGSKVTVIVQVKSKVTVMVQVRSKVKVMFQVR